MLKEYFKQPYIILNMAKNLLGAQSVEALTYNDKYDNNVSFERNGGRFRFVNKQIGKQLLKEIYPDYDNSESLKENISNFYKEVSRDINPDNNDKHNMSYHNVHDYGESFVLLKRSRFDIPDSLSEPKIINLSHVSHHQLNKDSHVTTAFISVPVIKIKTSGGSENALSENKLNTIKEDLLENVTRDLKYPRLIKKTYSLDTDIATKKINVSQDIPNDCVELGKKYGLGTVIYSSDRTSNAGEILKNNCIVVGYAGPGDNKPFRQSANSIRKTWDSEAEPEAETKATLIFKYGNPMLEDTVLHSKNVKVGHKECVEFEKLNYNDLKYIEINDLASIYQSQFTSECRKLFNETAEFHSYFFLKAGKISINPTFQQKNDGSDATNDDDKTTTLDIKCENLNLFMSIFNKGYANNNDTSGGKTNTFINVSIPEISICCHTNADIDHVMNDASYVVTKAVLDSIDLPLFPHF